jgi:hypothetical protein
VFAWEDIKAMFNGGSRKRMIGGSPASPPPSPFTGSDVISTGAQQGKSIKLFIFANFLDQIYLKKGKTYFIQPIS